MQGAWGGRHTLCGRSFFEKFYLLENARGFGSFARDFGIRLGIVPHAVGLAARCDHRLRAPLPKSPPQASFALSLHYSRAWSRVIQKSVRLEYEPYSEPLHNSAK